MSAAAAAAEDVEMKEEIIDNAAFDEAVSIEDVNPNKAIQLYHTVLDDADATGTLVKIKEESILRLASLYAKTGKTAELKQLLVQIRPFFSQIPKSRTAKI